MSNFFNCYFQRDTNIDHEVEKYVQPQLVGVGEVYDLDALYVVCEGRISYTLPQLNIIDGIIALLGSFYVFNMAYIEGRAILSFFRKKSCFG